MSLSTHAKMLLGTLAPLALMLPLVAQAAWPPGAREDYMKQCQAAAEARVDAKQALAHCTCGAQVIEKKFTTAEITSMNDPQTPPPQPLREKLLKEIKVCKTSG